MKIKILDALQYMSYLRELNIDHTAISDISIVENMDSLKNLSFEYTNVADIGPITYLEDSEILRMSAS